MRRRYTSTNTTSTICTANDIPTESTSLTTSYYTSYTTANAVGLAAAIGSRWCFFSVSSNSTTILHAKDGGEEGRRAQGGSCRL